MFEKRKNKKLLQRIDTLEKTLQRYVDNEAEVQAEKDRYMRLADEVETMRDTFLTELSNLKEMKRECALLIRENTILKTTLLKACRKRGVDTN